MVKKQDILDATYKLFAQKGYYLSMADIAGEVGLKVPSIYSHFQSKDEIIFVVMESRINSYYEHLENEITRLINEDLSSEEKLKTICFSVSKYFTNTETIRFWKNISLIYHEDLRLKCRDLVKSQDEKIFRLLQQIYDEGSIKGELKEEYKEGVVLLFWTMMQGILDTILVQGGMSQEFNVYLSMIWKAYWNGIKK